LVARSWWRPGPQSSPVQEGRPSGSCQMIALLTVGCLYFGGQGQQLRCASTTLQGLLFSTELQQQQQQIPTAAADYLAALTAPVNVSQFRAELWEHRPRLFSADARRASGPGGGYDGARKPTRLSLSLLGFDPATNMREFLQSCVVNTVFPARWAASYTVWLYLTHTLCACACRAHTERRRVVRCKLSKMSSLRTLGACPGCRVTRKSTQSA
jgi:hypothetical protein